MNSFALSGVATGTSLFALIIIVLMHDYKSWLNRIFSLYLLSVSWWGFGVYEIANAQTVEEAFFWFRIAHIGVIFIAIFFFHFIHVFLGITRRKLMYFLYGAGFLFLVADATPYFISNMRYVFNSFYYHSPPGMLYVPFFIFWASLVVYSHYVLFREYRRASGVRKKHILYLFIAGALAFSTGSTAYLPVFGIDFHPAPGTFLISVYPIIVFYAILRQRLLNVKAVFAELFTISTWVIFFIHFLFSGDSSERFINSVLLAAIVILGIFAIRSVHQEAGEREKLQDLAQNLQQKVAEQTKEIRGAYEVEKQARKELEVLDKEKDQFILTTQHHLRTPLTIMMGYLDILLGKKAKAENFDPEARIYLEKISKGAERMNKLVNEFLDVSQFEIGKTILNKTSVNLKKLIEDIREELELEIKKKPLNFEVSFTEEAATASVNVDLDRFREAVFNIIDNAVKYTQTGGIFIKGELIAHPIEKTKYFRLTVKDTGIGIGKEDLLKIFARFFQRGEQAQQIYASGRGIGLVVTRSIIEAHGGRVWAKSEGEGRGATFIVELPID